MYGKAHGYQKVGIIRPVCGADFILGLTPLGFIYLPIAAITTVHIPVIVGSYVHGPKGGALLGGIFGLTSLIRCFSTPDATAAIVLGTGTGFGPYNLVLVLAIIFLPRVLTGLFSGLIYKGMAKTGKELLAMGTAAVAGSLTNTVFFWEAYMCLPLNRPPRQWGWPGKTWEPPY